MKTKHTCLMCHRLPVTPGSKFCGPECKFEWEEYDRIMDIKAPLAEERIIFPESGSRG